METFYQKQNREKSRRQKGAVLVESAIIFPVIIFLVFAAIQWGLIISGYVNLRSASATAARAAVLYDLGDNEEEIEDAIASIASDSVTPQFDPDQLTVVIDQTVTVGGSNGVRVELSYPFPVSIPFVVPGSVNGAYEITAATTVR